MVHVVKQFTPGDPHPLSGKVPSHSGQVILAQSRRSDIDTSGLHHYVTSVWRDFKKDNRTLAFTGTRMAGGLLAGKAVQGKFQSTTPLRWTLKGFGPLPYEEATGITLTAGQRLGRVGVGALATTAFTVAMLETGLFIGCAVSNLIPQETQDKIGDKLFHFFNEGGYKNLWTLHLGFGR